MTIPSTVSYVLAWFGFCKGIWFLFDKVEDTLKPEIRNAISNWLRNLKSPTESSNWPSHFISLFDAVFSQKLLSPKGFGRSCVASLTSAIIFLFIWSASRPESFEIFMKEYLLLNLISFFFLASILNFIPDYISLIESRYIIGLMKNRHGLINYVALLLVDLIFTCCIWILGMLLFLMILGKTEKFFEIFRDTIMLSSENLSGSLSYGIFFYSTFFTSIWVWLYALSGLVFKICEYLGMGLYRAGSIFNVKEKPLRSMGVLVIILVSFIFLFLPLFI